MPKVTAKWSEADIFRKLCGKWPEGAYVMLPQCRSATGSGKIRTADAIGASVWPSRGLYLFGIEIKVSRSDWKRELANPAKAAAILRYCKYWYVAAPKGVVPVDEMPETWGLLEIDGRGVKTTKAAPELTPEPLTIEFLCAVMRSLSDATVFAADVAPKIREAREGGYERGKSETDHNLKRLAKRVETFEETSGIAIDEWGAGDIGAAVMFVRKAGVPRALDQAMSLLNAAEHTAETIRKAIKELKADDSKQN